MKNVPSASRNTSSDTKGSINKNSRRKVRSNTNHATMNNIQYHQQNILSTIQSTSNRSDMISQRLKTFQQSFHTETKQDERIQWIRNYRKTQSEIERVSKSFMKKNGTGGIMDVVHVLVHNLKQSKEQQRRRNDATTDTDVSEFELNCQLFENESILKEGNQNDLLWGIIQKFVLENGNGNKTNHMRCKDVKGRKKQRHESHIHLQQDMKRELNRLDVLQEKLEEEIRNCKDSFGPIDDQLLLLDSLGSFQMQRKLKNDLEVKRNLQQICIYSRDIGLIENTLYHDLMYEIRAIKDLGQEKNKDINPTRSTWNGEKDCILRNEYILWKKQGESHNLKQKHLKRVSKKINESFDFCSLHWDLLDQQKEDRQKFKPKVESACRRSLGRSLNDIQVHTVDQIWQCSIIDATSALEDEQQFRLQLGRKVMECSRQSKLDIADLQRRRDEEKEKFRQDQRGKEQLDAKLKLEQYQFLQEMKQIEQNEEEEARIRIEELQKNERILTNKKRVKYRREELLKKNEKYQEALTQKEEKKMEKLEELKKLAASVPYHSSIISKKADLTKSTAARANDIFVPSCSDDLRDFQLGLQKLNCFTDEKIFSDPKFRLAHALHESGKANTAYSLAVVKQIIPRQQERTTGMHPSN